MRSRRRPGSRTLRTFSLFMQFLAFVLPVISRCICQSFRCDPYDAGDEGEHSFLFADPSIDCKSRRYWFMFLFASCMLLICESAASPYHQAPLTPRPRPPPPPPPPPPHDTDPIGAPLSMLLMLARHRHRLNPPGKKQLDVIHERLDDPELAADPITKFAMLYKVSSHATGDLLNGNSQSMGARVEPWPIRNRR